MGLRYRFVAVDVDGTLLNARSELPEANRLALHRAHEAGMTVCLCTGRSLVETRGVIARLGLDSDAGVFAFGAIVSRLPGGETLHRTAIPRPVASRVVAYFQSRGHPVLVLYDPTEASVDYRFVPGQRNAEACERWLAMMPASCTRLSEWTPGEHDPVRITVIVEPREVEDTMDGLRQEFPPQELKINPIFAPNYGIHVVECFAPQVSKWHGIMQLAGRMGITPAQVVAIGDDINDLEMVRQAGLGVAMGNAIDVIKAVAQFHAPSHDACGVAAAVDAILSSEPLPRPVGR